MVGYHSSAGSVAGDKVLSTSQRLVLHREGEKEGNGGEHGTEVWRRNGKGEIRQHMADDWPT